LGETPLGPVINAVREGRHGLIEGPAAFRCFQGLPGSIRNIAIRKQEQKAKEKVRLTGPAPGQGCPSDEDCASVHLPGETAGNQDYLR
jgi:hypothetical protein